MGSVMAKGTGTIMGQEMQSVLGEGQTVDGVIEHGRKVAKSLVDAGIILDSAAFNVIISIAWRIRGGGLEAAQRSVVRPRPRILQKAPDSSHGIDSRLKRLRIPLMA
jgi:hypothetical protein